MRKIIFGLLSLSLLSVFAQNEPRVLTLEECMAIALEKNIDLKRAKNSERIAEINKFQAMLNFLPSVNASINYDYFFGNFFDQNAARQVSETTNSSNPNIGGSLILFNGLSNQYNIKGRTNDQRAAEAGTSEAELNLKTNVLIFFLNATVANENMKIANDRVDLLDSQLDREKKRVSVGVGNMDAVYSIISQLASEKLQQTSAKNSYSSRMLTLIQAMQLDASVDYQLASIEVEESDVLTDLEPFDWVLSEAIDYHPGMDRAEASKVSANFQLKSSSASRWPTLSVRGVLGSNYSSNGARNPESGALEPDASFSDQIEYNNFQYVNFSLSIPVFNRYQASRNVQVDRVGVLNSELDFKQTELSITNTVQQAYLDMLNAQSSYSTAKENLEAQTSAFDFIKKRFDTGNTDFYSYFESLNNRGQAEAQMINAKYSITLRKKVLDLYRGK